MSKRDKKSMAPLIRLDTKTHISTSVIKSGPAQRVDPVAGPVQVY